MKNTTTPICELSKVADEMSKGIVDQDVAMNKNLVQSGNHHVINTSSVSYFNVFSPNSKLNDSATKNRSEQVGNTPVNVVSPLYATKLRPTSSTVANLHKLKVNVPNDADYHVWLPLDSVHEEKYGLKKVTLGKGNFFFKFSSTEGVDSVLRDGSIDDSDLVLGLIGSKDTVNIKEKRVVLTGSSSLKSGEDTNPMKNTTTPICEPFKVADKMSKGIVDQDVAMTKNPVQSVLKNTSEHFGNTPVNVVSPLYATKLRPTSSTMANLQKLKANIPNVADYHVWLPLDSVDEEKYRLKKVTLGKGNFFFKFSSTESVDSVLRDGP
nr:hypothetical protein [Tanacetum cinerariifolium]